MMPVTRFRANDGSEHQTPEAAKERDAVVAAIHEVEAPLGQRLDDCKFTNGGGYVQHDPKAVRQVTVNLLRLAVIEMPRWAADRPEMFNAATFRPGGFLGRLLDDSRSPLYRLYCRLWCIDEQNREWGQPYYAANPSAAKGQFEIAR